MVIVIACIATQIFNSSPVLLLTKAGSTYNCGNYCSLVVLWNPSNHYTPRNENLHLTLLPSP